MNYSINKKNNTLVLKLYDLEINLNDLIKKVPFKFNYFILDLLEFNHISDIIMENFIKFGKITVSKESFFAISKLSFNKKFPVIPSVKEAFDLIELEEIQKQL
tara:strand:- start:889 stop:1197 length:309 start_codon:yes stop_codon:yes gene_type:complete